VTEELRPWLPRSAARQLACSDRRQAGVRQTADDRDDRHDGGVAAEVLDAEVPQQEDRGGRGQEDAERIASDSPYGAANDRRAHVGSMQSVSGHDHRTLAVEQPATAVSYGARPVKAQASDVTLVVLNYNGRRFLELVLPSIAAQTVQGFSVAVVDDASTDDSIEYLAREWPNVSVARAERNSGVTASMALGIASASTPLVALLNNDLELDPRWLEAMMAELDEHPEAAAVDCKMLSFGDRSKIDGVGDLLRRNGYPGRRGQGEVDRGQYDEPAEVFSASGAAALYRRDAFDSVGPYDADFVAYYEDVDWGYRARLMGYSVWTAPSATAFHVGSATTTQKPGAFADLIVRNQILVVWRNFPGTLLLRYAPRMVFFQLKWLVFDIVHGRGRPHLRGIAGAARMIPATLRARRAIQRKRSVSAAELRRVLD
jgi:GT2 family glycosyltransferase